MVPISALEAARLVKSSYTDNSDLRAQLIRDGVQTSVRARYGQRILLIQGTNEISDWLNFNFHFWPKIDKGATAKWHRGFLDHASVVYDFAKDKTLDVVVGHSLGGAAAQIVGYSLGLPVISLGSPKPLYKWVSPKPIPDVWNFCREDDLVCKVPFGLWGFEHVGNVHWFKPKKRNRGQDHHIDNYIDIMT